MIKFFRKIRQSLLTKNKFSNYLFYAVGEIILVVIGILIALQINNWNEHKKAISKSRNYLTEFRNDLITDTVSINHGLKTLTTVINSELWALNKIHYNSFDSDSILLAFGDVYFDRKINDRTFSNVQNSGNSKLVGYDSLFTTISHYYIKTNELLKAHTEWDEKVVTEGQNYMDKLKETIENDTDYIKRKTRQSNISEFPMITDPIQQAELVIEFATSVQGRNHFKENYIRHLRLQKAFKQTKQEAQSLVEIIDKELKK